MGFIHLGEGLRRSPTGFPPVGVADSLPFLVHFYLIVHCFAVFFFLPPLSLPHPHGANSEHWVLEIGRLVPFPLYLYVILWFGRCLSWIEVWLPIIIRLNCIPFNTSMISLNSIHNLCKPVDTSKCRTKYSSRIDKQPPNVYL